MVLSFKLKCIFAFKYTSDLAKQNVHAVIVLMSNKTLVRLFFVAQVVLS